MTLSPGELLARVAEILECVEIRSGSGTAMCRTHGWRWPCRVSLAASRAELVEAFRSAAAEEIAAMELEDRQREAIMDEIDPLGQDGSGR